MKSELVEAFKEVPLHVAIHAWEAGTPEEKAALAPVMLEKIGDKEPQELKVTPQQYDRLLDDALLHSDIELEEPPEGQRNLRMNLLSAWHEGSRTRFSLMLNRAVRDGQLTEKEAAAIRNSVQKT